MGDYIHLRSVSAEQPILPAIEQIADHCASCSPACSRTRRTARSRTSGHSLVDVFLAPSSQEMEPPRKPGRFTLLHSDRRGLVRVMRRRGDIVTVAAPGRLRQPSSSRGDTGRPQVASAKELLEGDDAVPAAQPQNGEHLVFQMREPDPEELWGVGR